MFVHRSQFVFGGVCLVLALGCRKAENGRIGEGSTEMTFETRQIETVIAWANRVGAANNSWSVGDAVTPLTWNQSQFDEWVAEGRQIDNAEQILLQLLNKEDDRVHPLLVVQALGYVGSKKCIPALREKSEDKWDEMQLYAVIALTEIGLPECVPALATSASCGRTWGIRYSAIEGLSRLSTPDVIGILQRELERTKRHEDLIAKTLAKLTNSSNGDKSF